VPVIPELCPNGTMMQYYKGNALQDETAFKEEPHERHAPFFQRFWRLLLFPFMLIFWIIQDIIHKSVEE
jgi:hypothetical protein